MVTNKIDLLDLKGLIVCQHICCNLLCISHVTNHIRVLSILRGIVFWVCRKRIHNELFAFHEHRPSTGSSLTWMSRRDRCKDGGDFLSQLGVLLREMVTGDPRGHGFYFRETYVNDLSWWILRFPGRRQGVFQSRSGVQSIDTGDRRYHGHRVP